MKKQISTSYLVIAIIGIVTAIPKLGAFMDTFRLLTFILLGFSFFILVKQPNAPFKKTGALLMLISCLLPLFGEALLSILGYIQLQSIINNSRGGELFNNSPIFVIMKGIVIVLFIFSSWIIKIIAIVFSFITYGKLKTPVSQQNL